MKNANELHIETFLLINGRVAIDYFFSDEKEFKSFEIPLSLFNLWLIHNHNDLRIQFSYEGEVSWIDMFYYDIPKHIRTEFIMHLEKCKELNEMEAA